MRKLVACLACRNDGSRLYGKPLQNLDVANRTSILDYMIQWIRRIDICDEIVLAISEGEDNHAFEKFAKQKDVKYFIGDREDVLARLIMACRSVQGTDILRLTTESPFTYFEPLAKAWELHKANDNDLTCADHLPDGAGFELIKLAAYESSWDAGDSRHRSELCSLYIRENKNIFKIERIEIPQHLRRLDIRLTVDYPEDLVLCRFVLKELKDFAPLIPLTEIIKLLDRNDHIKNLVSDYVERGLQNMYV